MKIAVIGTGYVGLVTGACLAETGHEVTAVDIDAQKVANLQQGKVPIYEPGLEELFQRTLLDGKLGFTTDLATGIAQARIIFLALPTPPQADGSADLSIIDSVVTELAPLLSDYAVIVIKSTVPVGTAQKLRQKLTTLTNAPFDVVSNPEFLREGFAVADFMEPDRIVVGSSSEKAQAVMEELYTTFVSLERPLFFMDEVSAELTKYAANSFLVTKISFMNEIAIVSEKIGADVDAVREALGADARIGKRFLFPGIGYGGSCFPKDIRALQDTAQNHGYRLRLLEAAMAVNEQQQYALVEKLETYLEGRRDFSDKHFALWGLAFKPDTDDVREAPAKRIIDSLLAGGATVTAYDPQANANMRLQYPNEKRLTFAENLYGALTGADALFIATEWDIFKQADLEQIKHRLKQATIFDGRNIYKLQTMRQLGFDYISIGREPVLAR